ncbi:hypothetical protein DB032_19655 [Chromobacterium sp. Panama]|uniref:MBL fold metallo-hydrolase n=1 Tax=Chromobacterium sp. Panama TaxID=2161826 RepID=UPI000D31317A|nr:MBL fold metallo-hydrolase [Chromobacterium sp. Panama]PTU66979.1 hypothetical protein DB032_19655 [Chromobacterium sp. Panama]
MRAQPALRLEYIGHNAWYVSVGEHGLLIDPLLLPTFGNSAVQPFQVHPHAPVVTPEHLLCTHVLLTHEHSDHVHLGSLRLLPPCSNVYVGPVFPAYLERAVRELGHIVHRCDYLIRFDINGISICLYPCDPATAFWEQRVSQPLLSASPDLSDGIFMSVDALVSIEYLEELERNLVPPPSAIAISNNAYIMPPGHFGPLDSIGTIAGPSGIAGLDLLFELTTLPSPIDQIRPKVIVGGGGIRRFDETLHWPFCDQQELSRLGHLLAPQLAYEAPWPGDLVWVQDGDVHVHVRKKETQPDPTLSFAQARPPLFEAVVTQQLSGRSQSDCEALVQGELPRLEIALGMSLLSEYWWQAEHETDYVTILAMLRDADDAVPLVYALKGIEGRFNRIEATELNGLVRQAPFGLICHLQDFAAMIAGDVEIWDIAGKGIKCWHPPRHTLTNLASFLYAYFGEQVRPELATNCLARMQ